jgi:hypothetical protein
MTDDQNDLVARMHAALMSLEQFDCSEIRGVIKGFIAPTAVEQCYMGFYFRAAMNVSSLVSFKETHHFQAISMLARSLFELSVDVQLLTAVPDAVNKVHAFTRAERLRAARQIVNFKTGKTSADIPDLGTYQTFIDTHADEIDKLREQFWPGVKKVEHWSGMNLRERVEGLGAPFDETYKVNYPRLSWLAHGGLAGVADLEAPVFVVMCGDAFGIALRAYEQILTMTINLLGLGKAVPKVNDKMQVAKLLPFTDGAEQAAQLWATLD